MKRYLHFYYWLAVIMMMICGTATVSAQVKVTSLEQLKVNNTIKIYPKGHYGENGRALACSGNEQPLTSYEKAGSGDVWNLTNTGDGVFIIWNDLGARWAYQGRSSSTSLICSNVSSTWISLTWNEVRGGVCFWKYDDNTALNNLDGSGYLFNWWSYDDYGRNSTFDIALLTTEIIDNGIKYLINFCNKTAEVLPSDYGYKGNEIIPSSFVYDNETYKVISLGEGCFYGCRGLTSITLPEGITSLGKRCFSDCDRLTSITLPKGITSLGDYCFRNCNSLTNVNLPNGITSLGEGCFLGCKVLTSITLPKGITSLGDYCFRNCNSLTNVNLPNGITSLGDYCFYQCI